VSVFSNGEEVGRKSCTPNVPAFIVHQEYESGKKKDARMKKEEKGIKVGGWVGTCKV